MRNSRLILSRGIRLDKTYLDVIWKYSHEMVDICRDKAVIETDDFSIIRRTGNISVPYSMEVCLRANYIAFQNPDYESKWFFGWIDNCIYVNDGCTEIQYTIDIWSTWFDDWVRASSCYIERQMAVVDSWENPEYRNTQPENLNTGSSWNTISSNFINFSHTKIGMLVSGNDQPRDVQGATYRPAEGAMYDDIYSGLEFSHTTPTTDAGARQMNIYIAGYLREGVEDRIVKIFQFPDVFEQTDEQYHTTYSYDTIHDITTYSPLDFNGYEPRNNKLYTYPYRFLKLFSSNGDQKDLLYENFNYVDEALNCQIRVVGNVIPTVSAIAFPRGYNRVSNNFSQGVTFNMDLECAWIGDSYQRWLAVNQESNARAIEKSEQNLISSIVGGAVAGGTAGASFLGVGALPGAIGGAIAGGFSAGVGHYNLLKDQDVQQRQAAMQANIVHGSIATSALDVNYNNAGFHVYKYSITKEYAAAIDDYFDLYGYAWNKLDSPNIDSRPYFNYIKLAANGRIEGSYTCPSDCMEIINNIFRNGVRIWQDIDNVGDLSLARANH